MRNILQLLELRLQQKRQQERQQERRRRHLQLEGRRQEKRQDQRQGPSSTTSLLRHGIIQKLLGNLSGLLKCLLRDLRNLGILLIAAILVLVLVLAPRTGPGAFMCSFCHYICLYNTHRNNLGADEFS